MADERLSQLIELRRDAVESGDTDQIDIIDAEMFQEFGYDGKTGKVMRSKGSPPEGEVAAVMDATSNRATRGKVSRGAGAALRGTKFQGVK